MLFRSGRESSQVVITPKLFKVSAVSRQKARFPAMQSNVLVTVSEAWPAFAFSNRAARASVKIARAAAGPIWLGLQPGARCWAMMAPSALSRMHSVLVPPPSTPILQGVLTGLTSGRRCRRARFSYPAEQVTRLRPQRYGRRHRPARQRVD